MVAKGGTNPYRPKIPPSTGKDEINPGMINLMKECWNEDPGQRPDFKKVISKLEDVNKGKWVWHDKNIRFHNILYDPDVELFRHN